MRPNAAAQLQEDRKLCLIIMTVPGLPFMTLKVTCLSWLAWSLEAP